MSDETMITDPAALINGRVYDVTPAQARKQQYSRTAAFEDLLKHASTEARYQQWVNDPVTQAYLSALRELSYLPYGQGILPVGGDAAAQYGMTLAFQYAERLMRDPRSVLPSVFQAPDPGTEAAPVTYVGYSDAPENFFYTPYTVT